MRLGLLGSLVIHAGVVGVAWFSSTPRAEDHRAAPGVHFDMAPRLRPERPIPPPPELAAPATAPERVLAPRAGETREPIELAEALPPPPQPFRLRAVAKLATPLPIRRAPQAPPPTAKRPAPSRRAPQGKLVAPLLLAAPAARYPLRARRLGWAGRVVLELRVSARGTVEKVVIAASSGRAVLDRAAAEAALRWSFRPATREGKPIAHTVRIPVDFTLDPP